MGFVCPFCRHGIRNTSDICPACGRIFNKNDWVADAYDSKYLRSKCSFIFDSNSSEYRGFGSEFWIGREPGEKGIKFPNAGLEKKHAYVYFDSENQTWNIKSEEGCVVVDGVTADRGRALSPGAKLQIGQICFTVSIKYELLRVDQEESRITDKIEKTPLRGSEFTVGCLDKNNLVVRGAAEIHAKIYKNRSNGEWWIANCSREGTFVNGVQIHNERLFDGDYIRISGTKFIFSEKELKPFVSSGLSVDLEQVSVSRGGKKILSDVSAYIKKGEFVGVLGPSGCGKSSLIQRIVGLDSFDSGELKVNGNDFSQIKDEFLSLTSYLPQQVALHDDLTVREETLSFCRLHGIQTSEIASRLQLLGLLGEKKKKIGDLSGGQKRRLGIALGLLRNPQMLVLDEPTSGLDPASESDVMTYLRRIASQGKTVICSTHILGNLNLFDKVLLLASGRLIFWGTPVRLLSFFGVKSPYKIYRQLDNSIAISYFSEKFKKELNASSSLRKEIHSPKFSPATAILTKCLGYWERQIYEFLSFRNSNHPYSAFFQSPLFIQVFVQPLLVALAVKLSCAYKMTTSIDYKEVLFFCAVSVFWLGINNAVRELVRERVPWRCLERMEQINLKEYLFAKVVWNSFLSVVQIFVFAFLIFVFPEFSSSGAGVHKVQFSFGILLALLSIGITGAWVGLSISAFFKRETAAVGLLPIVLIPVLFFSQPIVQHDTGNYAPLAASIAEVMPCYEPQMLMAKIDEGCASFVDWAKMIIKTGLYAIFALGTMIFFQDKREREWAGR